MDFSKLAPWNWFKDEEESKSKVVPVKKHESTIVDNTNPLLNVQKELENMFEVLHKNFEDTLAPFKSDKLFQDGWFEPSLDVASNDDIYTIKLELPGVDKKNIEIEVENNTMRIKGEKKQESEEKNNDYYRVERRYGSFQRILNLPEDSDIDNIESEYKDGILSVNIPKKSIEQKDVKKIGIK